MKKKLILIFLIVTLNRECLMETEEDGKYFVLLADKSLVLSYVGGVPTVRTCFIQDKRLLHCSNYNQISRH